jgi:hypothetical protein
MLRNGSVEINRYGFLNKGLLSIRDLASCGIQQKHLSVLRRGLAEIKHVDYRTGNRVIRSLSNSLLVQEDVFDEPQDGGLVEYGVGHVV